MGTRTFDDYGELEFLEPEEFYKAPWCYDEASTAHEDGMEYGIVHLAWVGYRYTTA